MATPRRKLLPPEIAVANGERLWPRAAAESPGPAKTLRDELAMAAIGSLIAGRSRSDNAADLVNMAYQIADAMLAQRHLSSEQYPGIDATAATHRAGGAR